MSILVATNNKIGVHFSGMSFNALAIDWFEKR